VGGDTSEPKSFFEAVEKRGGGAVGFYNRFWLNQGSAYTEVDGQIRTSIVVDPPDGQVPPYNEAARNRIAAARATPTSTAQERQDGTAQPPAPTTIRSSGRLASVACSDSVPRPDCRRCRTISIMICIRSCRPRVRF
jgi:hypothetical protein